MIYSTSIVLFVLAYTFIAAWCFVERRYSGQKNLKTALIMLAFTALATSAMLEHYCRVKGLR